MGDQGDAGAAAGDVVPAGYEVIEVRVAELRQLFNAIDPSPFHERDHDSKAESFIVGWGSDLPPNAPLALVVHLERAAGDEHEAGALAAAIHEYFGRRATETRRRLRELFRDGQRLVDWDDAMQNALREIVAFDEFHDERGHAARLF